MAVPRSEAPRRSRVLSFTSNRSEKSHKTGSSSGKHVNLTEDPKDKESRRMHSKADPTLAMSEAQPGTLDLTPVSLIYMGWIVLTSLQLQLRWRNPTWSR